MSASQQLGIDLSLNGLQKVLADFIRVQKSAVKTGQVVHRAFSGGSGNGGSSSSGSGKLLAITGPVANSSTPAVITTSPNAKATASQSGGKLQINVVVQAPTNQMTPAGPRGMSRRKPTRLGPMGMMQRRTYLGRLLSSGALNPDEYADTKAAYERNERMIRRGTPQGRVMSALMSTRLNIGNASPLVGQTMGALGISEELAGPIGIAVGAVTALGLAFNKLADDSADVSNSFARLAVETGSGAGVNASLQALGLAGGFDPGAAAQRLQDRITSDPMAMAYGLQAGIYNMPGPFGDQDYGSQLLQAIKSLRAIADPQERLRMARTLGIPDTLPALNMSDRQFAYTQSDAALRRDLMNGPDAGPNASIRRDFMNGPDANPNSMTPQQVQLAADFQASIGRIQTSIQNLELALSPTILPMLTQFFNGIANIINSIADWINRHQTLISTIEKLVGGAVGAASGLGAPFAAISAAGDHGAALNENTRATKENTSALLGMPGAYGRGERTGAVPQGMGGLALEHAHDIGTIGLSAF